MHPLLAECFRIVQMLNVSGNATRTLWVKGVDEADMDAAHQWRTAVFVWWLNERFELGYDFARLFRAAICHDSHEGHAPGGDVAAFFKPDHPLNDPIKRNEEKERREAIGMRNLEEAIGDIFPGFIKTLTAYNERATAEERLVYAADKFLDSLLVVDDNGRTNHLIGTTLAEHHAYKGPKCSIDPTVAELYRLLHEHCTEHESELFPAPPA